MGTRSIVLTGLFTALIAISSYFTIPLGPVPHTLQIIIIVLAGLILGRKLSTMSVLIWILLGVFGLPVFAQGKAGAAVLLGPTGGFLIGFMACAYIVGYMREKMGNSFKNNLFAVLVGLVIVYVIGLLGFMGSFTYFLHKPMTVDKALSLAVVPFLPFDVVKVAVAAYLGAKINKALERAGYGRR